jgi:hypothetical protein
MAEPEGDDDGVDAGVQEGHGRRLSECVWCDVLGRDRGAAILGAGGVFGDESPDRVAGQMLSRAAGEQRVVAVPVALA